MGTGEMMLKRANRWPEVIVLSGSPPFLNRVDQDLEAIARSQTGPNLLAQIQNVSRASNLYLTIEEFTPPLRALWKVSASDGAVAYTVPSVIASYGAARRNEALRAEPSCANTQTISSDDCRIIRDAHANRLSLYTAITMGLQAERTASRRDGVAPAVLIDPFEWGRDGISSDEALLHEFVHCLQCLQGRTDVLVGSDWTPQRRAAFTNPAEEEAMKWQNMYRAERSKNKHAIDYAKRRI